MNVETIILIWGLVAGLAVRVGLNAVHAIAEWRNLH